jgi:hypothetical protein
MNTERQRQQAEDTRERAEEGRHNTEQERNVDENRRQMAEKQREVGEQLRTIARTSERLVVEYSTRSVLTRIEGSEGQNALRADSWNINSCLRGRLVGRLRHMCPV